MFAYVKDGQATVRALPASAEYFENDAWVKIPNLASAPASEQEKAGWFVVTEVPQPTITATQRADVSVQLVSGRPTQVWTVRNETPEEAAVRVQAANLATLTTLSSIQTKMTNLKTFLSDPDVETVLNRANGAAFDQTDRRALKTIIRQLRMDANFDIMLARLLISRYQPSLLSDISDT